MKNIKKIVAIGFLGLMNLSSFAQKTDYLLYVGTYTRKTSEGIYIYQFNSQTGDFVPVSIAKGIVSPSFLAISPNKRFLYATDGQKGDSVRAFSIDKKSGNLTKLNSQLTEGIGAVHLQVDKTNKWLIIGNYRSGNLSILPINPDGSLEKATQTIKHEGKSIDPERQDKPYVHSINIAPNNKDVFVPDLGTDKIMTYHLNAETGKLSAGNPPFTSVSPGAGPRHLPFIPTETLLM